MGVLRMVTNIQAENLEAAKKFYSDVLGLSIIMDHGWITTYGNDAEMAVQISFATEGGSGTDVPNLSIEVDDFEETLSKMKNAGFNITYGPAKEPWGVQRFYVQDPFGTLVNILAHT